MERNRTPSEKGPTGFSQHAFPLVTSSATENLKFWFFEIELEDTHFYNTFLNTNLNHTKKIQFFHNGTSVNTVPKFLSLSPTPVRCTLDNGEALSNFLSPSVISL